MCFTDDGRLWLAGTAPTYPGGQAPPDYDVLRVYDAAGSRQGSFLKPSLFTSNLASGRLHLAANQQSVVLFNSVTVEFVETSYEGRVGRVMNGNFSLSARRKYPYARRRQPEENRPTLYFT